ncbi:unnamed protein product [Arctogadus glacialis]
MSEELVRLRVAGSGVGTDGEGLYSLLPDNEHRGGEVAEWLCGQRLAPEGHGSLGRSCDIYFSLPQTRQTLPWLQRISRLMIATEGTVSTHMLRPPPCPKCLASDGSPTAIKASLQL